MDKQVKKTPLKRGPKFKYGKVRGRVMGIYTSIEIIKKITAIAKKNRRSRTCILNEILTKYLESQA